LRNQLLILARRPELGKGKTRLAQGIGPEKTLEVYRYLLNHTLKEAKSNSWETNLFLAGSSVFKNNFGFEEFDQIAGDLGEKMNKAFETVNTGGKVVMIGTDCPELTNEIIAKAYLELDDKEVVFGPSKDGGYYLIGMRSYQADLLKGIPWSTEEVLEVSLGKCKELNLSVGILRELNDIDTVEDLRASKLTSKFDF